VEELAAKYQCELSGEIVESAEEQSAGINEEEPVADSRSFLQPSAKTVASRSMASVLSTSVALERATKATHHLLDSHGPNSSIHATIQDLEGVWKGVCKSMDCDHANYWDIFCASHGHSQALIEVRASARLLNKQIQNRVGLEIRVQHFLGKHGAEAESAGNFFSFEGAQEESLESMYGYADKGRAELRSYVLGRIAKLKKTEHVLRLVDQDALSKFLEEHPEIDISENSSLVRAWQNYSDAEALTRRASQDHAGSLEETGSRRMAQDQMDGSLARKNIFSSIGNAIGGAVTAVVDTVGSAISAVVNFVVDLFECFGQAKIVGKAGFGRKFPEEIPPAVVVYGVSVSITVAMSIDYVEMLMQGHSPPSISAGISFVTPFVPGGGTTGGSRSGVGIGGNVACGHTGCKLAISVGAVVSAFWPTNDKECLWQTWLLGIFRCLRSGGVTVTIMCCSLTLHNGETDCR